MWIQGCIASNNRSFDLLLIGEEENREKPAGNPSA